MADAAAGHHELMLSTAAPKRRAFLGVRGPACILARRLALAMRTADVPMLEASQRALAHLEKRAGRRS